MILPSFVELFAQVLVMRTSPLIIKRVAYWLEYFTLAELIFVLQEDVRMYPFDKFRVQKIASAVRHTFSSDQSDADIKMLIEDLSTAYCQPRPLVKPTSLSSNRIRHNDHLLVPYRTSCPTCNQSLNVANCKQRHIRLYCYNGAVVIATMFTLQCNHTNASYSSAIDNSPVTIFPNFIRVNDRNIYTHESLYFGHYVYLGGEVAIERSIIDKFIAQIVHHDISMCGSAASMNQEALNGGRPQLVPVDRHILTNIIHAFLVIQNDISVGHINVSIPCQFNDFDEWAWHQFPRLLACFIYLWINHRSIIGPCGAHCSKCLVVDGHQKCRRRICAFKDVKVNTEEMSNVVIGCCHTPGVGSRYCELHDKQSLTVARHKSELRIPRKRICRKIFRHYSDKTRKNDDHLNATGCRTLKVQSDEYIEKCSRSFGIIAIVSNCRIITSFSELYRSETLKEIVNLFAVTARVGGQLAPSLVYDDGCHLLRYVINHIGRDIAKTPAMELLASTPISVDRSHFRNHIGKFCRERMNPDNNPLLNNVNTQAAEQTFSWLKKYANIMSNMGHLRAPLFMLTLFHLKNLSTVNKSPSLVFEIASLCPKVDDVSLCHLAHNVNEQASVTTGKKSVNIEQRSTCALTSELYHLPKGTTDWDSKLFAIMNEKEY